MLNIALQNSSCEGDEFADRLYVVQSGHSGVQNPFLAFSNHQHSLGTSVDCNSKSSPRRNHSCLLHALRFLWI